MKAFVICIALVLIGGCSEENRQRILFRDCVEGVRDPAYADVVNACAAAATALREETKRASSAQQ